MSYRPPTNKPCSDCPFRRAAAPGWLGAGSPESFLDCMQRDEPLPCHQTVDYDDPNWLSRWIEQESGSMCAGALIFMANKMQRPRSREFPTMPPDKATVFSDSVEFVRYHREAAVHSWDDDTQNEGAQLHRELVKRAAEASGQPIVDHKNVSGRRPPKQPNLQNIPIRSELGRKIREGFVAAEVSTTNEKKKTKRPYVKRGTKRCP